MHQQQKPTAPEEDLRTEIFGEAVQIPDSQASVARLTAVLRAHDMISVDRLADDHPTVPEHTRRLEHSGPWIAPPSADHTSAMTGAPAWVPDPIERLAEPRTPLTIGAVLKERFELVEVLGHGGMGVVYKAIDRRKVDFGDHDHFVAIKVLSEEFKRHPEAVRALQLESKKSMKLAHPNIVQVRDFDRDDGNVYMVMELLEGQSLQQLQRERYPRGLPLQLAMDIVTGLGAALGYAHEQGIVHSDFKPSNAFITTAGRVKVLDFGVARAHQALDLTGQTVFDVGALKAMSPPYASIEMLSGASPDPRDDIYALACVTYVMLTGRHPFSDMPALLARNAGLAPARIKELASERWQALTAALAFERGSRTPTVREFVARFCGAGQRRRSAWIAPVALLVLAAGAAGALYLRREPASTPAVSEPVAEAEPVEVVAPAEPVATTEPVAAEPAKPEAAVASAPLSPEVKQRMIESFMARAAQQISDGDPDAALETLAAGRKRMGYGNLGLKNMEIAFARAAEEFDRIRTAASLSVPAHRQYLDQIREASGDLYPQVEQMLARTLADQIADLRARGDRDSVATALLQSGRTLFPAEAALLEHGTAGQLSQAPVAVADDT